jgi:hypothetical protein
MAFDRQFHPLRFAVALACGAAISGCRDSAPAAARAAVPLSTATTICIWYAF